MATGFNTDGGIHRIPLEGTVGQLYVCGKHHIGPNVDDVISTHNIMKVVCLVEEHELTGRYDKYVQWHKENAGGRGLWRPMHDLTFPELPQVINFVEEVAHTVRDHGNVVVHCAAGIGRAGTTAAAVCMILGMSQEEALEHVRAHRPMAGPEAGSQVMFIEELADYLAT